MLIWYLKGDQNALDLITSVPYDDRSINSLCIMELIQGCLNKKELKDIREFVSDNISLVIHPDEKISEKAILLLERYSLSDGLRTVDSIIAASALVKKATLATANFKHFKNISELDILKFRPLIT